MWIGSVLYAFKGKATHQLSIMTLIVYIMRYDGDHLEVFLYIYIYIYA